MSIPEHKFISARFYDNARTTVEATWEGPDGKTRLEYIVADEDNVHWKNLLTHIDIDDLHEATYKNIKQSQRTFEATAIQIARDTGILSNYQDETVINDAILKTLFNTNDSSEAKNTLFVFKLKLFELEFIKKCKTRKLKSDLRKAENVRQAVKVAIEIFEQSN